MNIKVKNVVTKKHKGCVVEEYIIDGFDRGFGNTIGNALRRVIISYTPGIAINGAKFSCFKHEFDRSYDVVEDAIDVINRLKDVIFKYNERFVDGLYTINIRGPVCFKAGDMNISGLEVINKDFVILNISSDIDLNIVLSINKSSGFAIHESNSEGLETGFVGVTSIYSRILKVNYQVSEHNISSKNSDTLTFVIEHNSVYDVGFVIKNAISKLSEVLAGTLSSIDLYFDSKTESIALSGKQEIVTTLSQHFDKDVITIIEELEFNSATELLDILTKNTYKSLKLKKAQIHDLCNKINKIFINKDEA